MSLCGCRSASLRKIQRVDRLLEEPVTNLDKLEHVLMLLTELKQMDLENWEARLVDQDLTAKYDKHVRNFLDQLERLSPGKLKYNEEFLLKLHRHTLSEASQKRALELLEKLVKRDPEFDHCDTVMLIHMRKRREKLSNR